MTDHRDEKTGVLPAQPELPVTAAPAIAEEKRPFVEPVVGVPIEVLEATAFFQAPTVQTAVVP